MHNIKRLLSIFLVFAMVLPWIPAASAQTEGSAAVADTVEAVVYLDQANGSDDNDGLTAATAKATLDGAYSVLKAAMTELGRLDDPTAKGKIVLVTEYDFVFSSTAKQRDIATASEYAHAYEVIYTGMSADTALTFTIPVQCYIGVIGPTTFENIHISIDDDSANQYLTLHGRAGYLRIGEGVTNPTETKRQLSISAAPYFSVESTVADYRLEINSGTWRTAYASGYTSKIMGQGTLEINGGTVNSAAVVFNGTHTGEATIQINGGTVNKITAGAANTGTVTGNVAVTLTGGTVKGAIASKNVSGSATVDLAPTRGLTLDCGGAVTANTLTGGELTLAPGTMLNITDSVTGVTNVTVQGGVRYGSYITAPTATANDAIVFTQEGVTVTQGTDNKTWECTDPNKMTGLKLCAASGVTVKLYPGFSGGDAITPDKTTTENGQKCYYFSNLKGSYRYNASGSGYYTIVKNIYVSEAEAQVLTAMDVTPSKRGGAGWEPTKVVLFTDEYIANKPSDATLWPDFQEAFQTPEFTTESAEHRHTTQKEMEDFIDALDVQNPDMYTYTMGTTAYGNAMPLVVFTKTDLSNATTLEEVAELVRDNGKLTIHYQAHMHGNEPAAGEGALAMILKLCGEYGEDILDTVNIYVIPRLNPDGAQDNIRKIPTTGIDLNRDSVLAQNIEMKALHYVTNLFRPHVMLDSHEYTAEPERTVEPFHDLLISPGFNPTSGQDFIDLGITMTQNAFVDAQAQGLSYNYYTSIVNSRSAYVGRNYAALEGTLFFLIETRGIGYGNQDYERRTVGHLITATSFFDYIVENVDTVRSVVDAEKQRIIDAGKTYEESDVLVLESSESRHPELDLPTIRYNTATGVGTADTLAITVYDVINRSRPAPTAYVIADGESWTQAVLDIMDVHSIEYYKLDANSVVKLQSYTGNTTEADLTQEMPVSFPQGAWVIPMDQEEAKIIGMLMEPDVTDISAGDSTLAMAGIIPATADGYPIYRYIHDLEADGTVEVTTAPAAPTGLTAVDAPGLDQTGSITGLDANQLYEYRAEGDTEYTQVPAGSMTIENLAPGTYYVRFQATADSVVSVDAQVNIGFAVETFTVYLSTTGSDSNSGYEATAPVATVATAYAQLDALMAGAPEGTVGKIVVSGLINLGSAVFNFPECSYPVVITGSTASDGFTYKGGTATNGSTTVINFKGDTTLENLTLKLTSTHTYNYIGANGHKLVLGDGLTCVANSKGAYFNVCGGSFNGTYASTDLTIRSGSWRNIYYGSYTGTVSGDAKLTMTGGMFTNYIQSGYNSTVSGDCYVYVSGAQAGTRIVGGATSTGKVKGDITVTLGKEITGTPVVTPCASGTNEGSYTLILDGADVSGMTVTDTTVTSGTQTGATELILKNGTIGAFTGFDTVTLHTDGYVKLAADITKDMTVKGDSYLDLNGHTLTGDLTGTGTLHGMDSTGDEYALPAGRITGTASCQIAKEFKTDVTGAIKRYLTIADASGYTFHRIYVGVTHMSLKPTNTGVGYKAVFAADSAVQALFAESETYGFTLWVGDAGEKHTFAKNAETFVSGETLSLRLQNFDVANYGETKVYGQVFMKLADGTVIESATYSYTLRELVESVAANLSAYSAQQITALQAMITANDNAMKAWDIDSIRNYTAG